VLPALPAASWPHRPRVKTLSSSWAASQIAAD